MPLRHKETNTNRFVPFNERLDSINVDVFHRIGHRYEEQNDEEIESFFSTAVEKWNDLNCSKGWEEFRSNVEGVRTLAQVVLLKEKLAKILLEHLQKKDPLTVQALLEIVVALARDLRQDFYPYYPDFLSTIISYLNCKEADILEYSFHCLAYLFKFLWRCMIRNIGPVLSSLLPLLSSSRKKYINYFAADSFAFLARKVKDQVAFISLLLNHLADEPQDAQGCGRLVFAWLRGVKGQLHSCAQNVLLSMIQSLGSESLPSDVLLSLTSETISHLVVEIRPGGLTFLWEAIKVSLKQFHASFVSGKIKSCNPSLGALKLLHQLCVHCNAVHITKPVELVDLLLYIYSSTVPLPVEILSQLSSITAILFMSPTVRLPQDRTVKLSSKVLATSPPEIILAFVKQILSWSAVDTLILPRLLEIVASGLLSDNDSGLGLQILAQLVQFKVPSMCNGRDEHNMVQLSFDFAVATHSIGCDSRDICKKLLSVLEISQDLNNQDFCKTLKERIYALHVLPHIKPLEEMEVLTLLKKQFTFLCKQIEAISFVSKGAINVSTDDKLVEQEKQLSQLLFVLFATVEAAIRIQGEKKDLNSLFESDLILETLLPQSGTRQCRLSSLRILNLYLSSVDFHNLKDSKKASMRIYESLKYNLAAPHHLVREMTCRVFCLLPFAPEIKSLFRVCLEAEMIAGTVTDYRDKNLLLQRLSFDVTRSILVKYADFRLAPLLFILGSFYVNFQLLWGPLQGLLSSFATGMTTDDFWHVFHGQLTLATQQRDFSPLTGTAPEVESQCTLVDNYYSSVNSVDDKPDHAHYRLLLYQAGQSFPEVCEKKNRDLSVFFLTFIEQEFYSTDADVAKCWDIKKRDEISAPLNDSGDDGDDDDDNEEEDEEEGEGDDTKDTESEKEDENEVSIDADNNEKETKPEISKSIEKDAEEKPSARLRTKTLIAYLQLFSKFRNPRTMYREPEIYQIYIDLLSYKHPDVQKAALECIFTYKHKFLIPYSEHLFALINDKLFKNEVAKFKIDKESAMIQEEHRMELIPIVMRLVYSKMTAKAGMRTGGKAGPGVRRSLVLRFLAGCHEDEMLIFMKMAFKFFDKYMQDDLPVMVESIQTGIDLEKVVPPRRLQSAVNLLSVVLDKFGGLMGNRLLSLILQLLTCVGATVNGIFKQRDNIHVGYLKSLRALRISCLDVLTRFFDRFEAYPWTASEIDVIMQVFITPIVSYLPVEGIHSPTAILKLFLVWSQHPRYFILFGSHDPNSLESNPLSAIMKLLLGAKTHHSVTSVIMEMLENLYTLKDHGKFDENDMEVDETYVEERAPPIPITHVLSFNEIEMASLSLADEVNLGSKLLFPHISSILERFRVQLAASAKRGSGLNKRELRVLACVSEFVRTPEYSATLTELLVPILTRRIRAPHEDEEIILKMMCTLTYLMKNIKDPSAYIRPIAALFSCINGVAGRKMLLSLVKTIAETGASLDASVKEEMELMTTVSFNLNAFDKRWVEQPDFDTRLEAFKTVQTLLDSGHLSVNLGVIVIHHCFYVIREEKDMSLRDFAAHCLRRVAPILSNQYRSDEATRKFLVDTTLLTLIRNNLKQNSNENAHSESVLLLGELARECSNLHPVLCDLNLLTNKEDVEVDFFENLQHLQFHRKTRALLKICEVYEKVEKAPTCRTLTQFILPLSSQFLCNEKHVGKNSLIDAAIQVLGIVARLLPWHQYETLLRYYLGKLRASSLFQKQLSRIVMSILDSFHFDLSKAELAISSKKQSSEINNVNDGVRKTSDLEVKIVNVEDSSKNSSDINDENIIEDLEEALEGVKEDEAEVETEDTKIDETVMDVDDVEPPKVIPAVERLTVLSPNAALRVTVTIRSGLLPMLHNELTARSLSESTHKVNKKQLQNTRDDRDAEEEEILRVPIAFAVVKLLQRLPKNLLVRNLPGVFARLCTFLKSRLESVRRVTRETCQKVILSLGPSYLSTLLKEMTSLLTRGYQVHVLVFTMHSVLISLKEVFGPGDIDPSLPYIIEVCKHDLFGYAAQEKEEGKVGAKVQEARSNKSYNTLQIVAQYVSENHLTNLLLPFKEIIQTAHSHKIVNRASECLRLIVAGLTENVLIPPSSVLIFAAGVASESIPALVLKQTETRAKKQKEKEGLERADCYLITAAPKQRMGITSSDAARVAARMNAHLFVEFGLRLIAYLLRREKLKGCPEELHSLVDPLIPLMKDCLSSQHAKLSTLSLQCLSWLLKMDLPSLRSNISSIAALIFGLLHKFAAAGLSKGDNFDLVVAAFKAVAVLVRDVKYHILDQDQLKTLLLYAEQDIADAHKNTTAFALLKAILSRKLIAPEIHEVMNKVATLSITSDLDHVRVQARNIFHQFLIDYPLGKKLDKHLSFYLSQLNYELQPGRESALEMVNSVICTFPVGVLAAQSGLFFLMLGARLVNDDAPECRKMVAQCLSKMLDRLSQNDRDRLFNIAFVWLKDKQVSHRRLASQLCGLFVLCEKENFRRRLPEVLPAITSQFQSKLDDDENVAGKFVRAPSTFTSNNEDKPFDEERKTVSQSERAKDHHVYQLLQFVLKICNYCPSWLSVSDFSDHVYSLTEYTQSLLGHPHEWVRLSSAQILTHILGTINIESLAKAVKEEGLTDEDVARNDLGFFSLDTTQKLKSMILDHCAQLTPGIEVAQDLLLQIVKNLVIFADVLKDINEEESATKESSDTKRNQKSISLLWLVKRMRKVVNMEVVQAPKSTIMRTMVLNWTAAIVVKLGAEHIKPVLHHLIAPIVRELSSDESAPEGSEVAQLRILSKQVGSLVKKTVGTALFIETQSRLQSQITTVRAERKMKRKHEAVAEPEKAAKRKIQKQVRKKEQKKIRKAKIRGKKLKGKKEVDLE